MADVLRVLPELEGEEMIYVQHILDDMPDRDAQQFANVYRARRQDPQTILLTTILGFIVIAGVQRFLIGQIGMGLLYLFTGGFCLVGTIIDLINHRKLAFEYNQKIANEVAMTIR
jgi:TM2 domain-containing membrane protein YozV